MNSHSAHNWVSCSSLLWCYPFYCFLVKVWVDCALWQLGIIKQGLNHSKLLCLSFYLFSWSSNQVKHLQPYSICQLSLKERYPYKYLVIIHQDQLLKDSLGPLEIPIGGLHSTVPPVRLVTVVKKEAQICFRICEIENGSNYVVLVIIRWSPKCWPIMETKVLQCSSSWTDIKTEMILFCLLYRCTDSNVCLSLIALELI